MKVTRTHHINHDSENEEVESIYVKTMKFDKTCSIINAYTIDKK